MFYYTIIKHDNSGLYSLYVYTHNLKYALLDYLK